LQTEPPDWCLEAFSVGLQFGEPMQDADVQTDNESVDSGIQVGFKFEITKTEIF
jgi:hypothetical protein